MRFRRALAGLAALTVLGNCGGSASGISDGARTELGLLAHAVRTAAEAGDRPGTERALSALEQAVASDRNAGHLDATRASAILAAAIRVHDDLATLPTTTIATTSTTTAPSTTAPTTVPPPATKPKNGGKGHHGKGDG